MTKTIFLILALFYCFGICAQNGYLLLKKGKKDMRHYWKDMHFTFQTRNRQWITGIITKISNDSFCLTQEIIHYHLMGSDTLHFSGFQFSPGDVYALPTKREEIVYDNDQVRVILGHEKFVWVRNGFIFQAGGAAYAGLNVINSLIHKEPPFAKNNLKGLGIGTAVFLIGMALHLNFDPYIHLGKKYRLECVTIPGINPQSIH